MAVKKKSAPKFTVAAGIPKQASGMVVKNMPMSPTAGTSKEVISFREWLRNRIKK